MRRLAISISMLLFAVTSAIAAFDTTKMALSFGINTGHIYFQSDYVKPDIDLDVFTFSRKNYWNYQLGFGYMINPELEFACEATFGNAYLRKSQMESTFNNRYPNDYFYDDEEVDNTNSSFNGLKIVSFNVGMNPYVTKGNWTIIPLFRAGIASYHHRDYSYVLRSKNSNSYRRYDVELQRDFQLISRVGLRFARKKFPNTYLEISHFQSHLKFEFLGKETLTNSVSKQKEYTLHSTANLFCIGVHFQTARKTN